MQQGTPFGAYILLGELGTGGAGVVYRAWHGKLQRHCALKMLHARVSSPEARERFAKEAKASAKLGKHPNIVQVFDAGVVGDVPYMAMEMVKGAPLDKLLKERGRLTEEETLDLGKKIALAMDHAHARGIVHRDIKPGNVILDTSEEPQVLDFGLAKDLNDVDDMSVAGVIMGTPAYLSPEQAEPSFGKVDHRSDIYSLGATLYTALTADLPFRANTVVEMLIKVLTVEPPNLTDRGVSQDLRAVISKAMEKHPADRYQSALELADDLTRVMSGEVPHARSITRRQRITRWVRRHPFVVSGIALGMLIAFALTGWFMYQRSEADLLWQNLSKQIASSTVDEAYALLEPAIPLLSEMKAFAREDILPVTDFDALPKHLLMRFEPRKSLDWISYGRQDGHFLGVKRDRDRNVFVQRNDRKRVLDYKAGEDFKLTKVKDEEDTYDPRNRPWYSLGASKEIPVWTEPYVWYAGEGIGITATVADRRRDGSLRGVFTTDFRLHSLSLFLAKLDLGEGGEAYLLRGEPPSDPKAKPALVLAGPNVDGETPTPPLVTSAVAASTIPLVELVAGEPHSVRFIANEEAYLGAFEAFTLPGGMRWVTLIVVPESTLGLSALPIILASSLGIGLILLALLALFVSRAREGRRATEQATIRQQAFKAASPAVLSVPSNLDETTDYRPPGASES